MSACQTKTLFKGFLLALDLSDFDFETTEHANDTTSCRQVIEVEFANVHAMCKEDRQPTGQNCKKVSGQFLVGKAGDAIRTRDFHVGNVTLYH